MATYFFIFWFLPVRRGGRWRRRPVGGGRGQPRQLWRRRGLVGVVDVELVGAIAVFRTSVVVGDDKGVELLLSGEVRVRAVHELFRRQRRNGDSVGRPKLLQTPSIFMGFCTNVPEC